jgi:hypothetical protein
MIALGALSRSPVSDTGKRTNGRWSEVSPLPRSPMPLVLSLGIGAVAVIAVILALIGTK